MKRSVNIYSIRYFNVTFSVMMIYFQVLGCDRRGLHTLTERETNLHNDLPGVGSGARGVSGSPAGLEGP
jgi:hypothetical protein